MDGVFQLKKCFKFITVKFRKCVVLLKEYHILISLNSNSFIKDGTIKNMLKKTYIKVVQNTIHKITDMLIIKKSSLVENIKS